MGSPAATTNCEFKLRRTLFQRMSEMLAAVNRSAPSQYSTDLILLSALDKYVSEGRHRYINIAEFEHNMLLNLHRYFTHDRLQTPLTYTSQRTDEENLRELFSLRQHLL